MFYFANEVRPAGREQVVGIPLETAEFRRQLIFLRGGRIVRNDLLPTDIEGPIENEIDFRLGNQPDQWTSCDSEAQLQRREAMVELELASCFSN
jgi:hypothetical protein